MSMFSPSRYSSWFTALVRYFVTLPGFSVAFRKFSAAVPVYFFSCPQLSSAAGSVSRSPGILLFIALRLFSHTVSPL